MSLRKASLLGSLICLAAAAQNPNPAYVLGPDSQPKPGVPKGKTTKYTFDRSKVYPGTTRSYWIYVPTQYDPAKPACLMIFQDGAGYANETGGPRATVVMDNLIAEGSMPVTIGLFVDPGTTPGANADQMARYHRAFEYDSIDDRYARFLIEDMIPEVGRQYRISADPNDRGVAGGSSGGIASFVAAFQRPDAFRRVISYIGSFAALRGGDQLQNMVRKMEPEPLRIFQQDGSADQSIYGGWWFIENQRMAASLEYAGYDAKFVVGTEGHSGRQGASILPEALRWIWRDYPKPIVASKGGPGARHYITDFLDPNAGWQRVGDVYGAAGALAVGKEGAVFFADLKAGKIYRIGSDGKASPFKDAAVTALMFGPDQRLYAAQPARHRIVSWAEDGSGEQVVAQGVDANDIAVTSKGDVYFIEPAAKRISVIGADRKKRVAAASLELGYPSSLRLTPDEHLVDVADRDGRSVWSFEIAPDGVLRYGMAFHHLEMPDASSVTDALSLTHDNTGHVYVGTSLGIQISDQPGRVVGIIRNPEPGTATSLVFGGANLETLYATIDGKIYARHLRRAGSYPWQPVKQPRPTL